MAPWQVKSEEAAACVPVYEEMPGWTGSTVGARRTAVDDRAVDRGDLGDPAVEDGRIATDGVLTISGNVDQTTAGGDLTLVAGAAPSTTGFSDAELASLPRLFNGLTLQEASATIVQTGGRIATASGSQLNLRTTGGGSISLEQSNQLGGSVSALSTPPSIHHSTGCSSGSPMPRT